MGQVHCTLCLYSVKLANDVLTIHAHLIIMQLKDLNGTEVARWYTKARPPYLHVSREAIQDLDEIILTLVYNRQQNDRGDNGVHGSRGGFGGGVTNGVGVGDGGGVDGAAFGAGLGCGGGYSYGGSGGGDGGCSLGGGGGGGAGAGCDSGGCSTGGGGCGGGGGVSC